MSEKLLSIYKEPVRPRNTASMLEVLLQNFGINGEHKMPEVGSEPNSLEKLDSAISPSAVQLEKSAGLVTVLQTSAISPNKVEKSIYSSQLPYSGSRVPLLSLSIRA